MTNDAHEQDAAVSVALAWVAAANAQDVDRLETLSSADIEIVGPRGAARGAHVLREWLARAGLTLDTTRVFAQGSDVVLQQRGTWQPSGATMASSADVGSWFRIHDGRVARYQRFDNLQAALAAAGLELAHAIDA